MALVKNEQFLTVGYTPQFTRALYKGFEGLFVTQRLPEENNRRGAIRSSERHNYG